MKTFIRSTSLPLLMAIFVILVFAFQWKNLDQIRQQVAAGLRSGLGEIAHETANDLGEMIESEIKKKTQAFQRIADSSVWDRESLKLAASEWNDIITDSQLLGAMSLAIVDQEKRDWDIQIEPIQRGKGTNKWAPASIWGEPLRQQLSSFEFWSENAYAYWEQTLDSLIYIQTQSMFWQNQQDYICQPIFDWETSRVMALACHPINKEYLTEHVIPGWFQQQFIRETALRADGIRREFLHVKLAANWGDLIYNSAVRGRTIMEQRLDLSKISPYMEGLILHMGFLGTKSENVALALHKRNQWLLLSVLAVFLGLIFLIYRTLRKAEKLDRLKSHFLANVTHELKTPLSGIMLANDTIRLNRMNKADELKQNSEIIYLESRRLQLLVNKLLDFSGIELNEASINPEMLPANDWLKKQLFIYRKRAEGEGFTWNEDLDNQLVTIKADPTALQTVVEILVDNAIRYSESTKTIHIQTALVTDHWVLRIRDKGKGIPVKQHQAIFEKFVRLDNSDVHDTKGMGIGLSIAKSIVEAHGGCIKLDSQPGRGSTFSIHLPL